MTDTLIAVIVAGGVILIIFFGWMIVRNEQVAKYRYSLIDFVFEDRTNYEMRLEWYRALPSHNAMARHPWRSLDSYLTGTYADDFRRWRAP